MRGRLVPYVVLGVLTLGLGLGLGLGLSEAPSAVQRVRPTTVGVPPQTKARLPTSNPVPSAPPTPSDQPAQPGPLAVSANGGLYVADDKLNQILELTPDGTFRVVAGTGTAGFSGDGSPAVPAEIDDPAGMAVASDGTLCFADCGNDRVRAISPNGIITSVAGNGASGGATAPPAGSPALSTALGMTYAVAIGPQGSLYLAASNEVLRLETDELFPVATAANFLGAFTESPQADECDPTGIAFDGSGDLYMTCSNFHRLLELEPSGSMVDRGPLRPHDAVAAITPGPDGNVVTVWQSQMLRVSQAGEEAIMDFDTVPAVGPFWPQGVAVATDGSIYADQDGVSGIGPPAIIQVSPDGGIQILWADSGG